MKEIMKKIKVYYTFCSMIDRFFTEKKARPLIFFYGSLFLPIVGLLLKNTALFIGISLVFSLVAIGEILCLPSSAEKGNRNSTFGLEYRIFLSRLRRLIRRVLAGDPGLSSPAIMAFLGVSMAIFAWFADAIKEGNAWLAIGTLLYVVTVLAALDVLGEKWREHSKSKRKVFVTPISSPHGLRVNFDEKGKERPMKPRLEAGGENKGKTQKLRLEKLKALKEARFNRGELIEMVDKDEYKLNGETIFKKPNFTPILAVAAHPLYQTLEELHLLMASDTIDKANEEEREQGELYLDVIENLATQLNPRLQVHRKWLGTPEEPVSGFDVKEFRKAVVKEYDPHLRSHSEDFVFGITNGTAAMSAAMILVAVRGFAEGVYVRQEKGATSSPVLSRVIPIKLDIYDMPDIDEAPTVP